MDQWHRSCFFNFHEQSEYEKQDWEVEDEKGTRNGDGFDGRNYVR